MVCSQQKAEAEGSYGPTLGDFIDLTGKSEVYSFPRDTKRRADGDAPVVTSRIEDLSRQASKSKHKCNYLKNIFVGLDRDVIRVLKGVPSACTQECSSLAQIHAPGFSELSLDYANVALLDGTEWVDDNVRIMLLMDSQSGVRVCVRVCVCLCSLMCMCMLTHVSVYVYTSVYVYACSRDTNDGCR